MRSFGESSPLLEQNYANKILEVASNAKLINLSIKIEHRALECVEPSKTR